jgi:hypothetical protein
MSDVDRSLITDRSLSTPCLDISLSDPVASLAAGPGNDPTASVHSLPAPACDTSPPASEERLTGGHEGAAPFQPRVLPKRLGFEVRRDHAEEELDWLHSPCALDPRHAGRRAVLMGWLDRLEPDDRAVIAFRYDRRVLSPMLADWVYVSTALVVALDIGIELVRDGIPDCVERSSVSHLEELILKRRTRHIDVLQRRAGRRFDEAVKAFARVRGHVAVVVPTPGEGQVTKATPIMAQEMTG